MKRLTSKRKHIPAMPWQIGPYARFTEFSFPIPYHALLLCKVLEVTPEDLLRDFLAMLSPGCNDVFHQSKKHAHLVDYIIRAEYGAQRYKEQEIRDMFTELNAISTLSPDGGSEDFREKHYRWREEYYNFWFKKWHGRFNREL